MLSALPLKWHTDSHLRSSSLYTQTVGWLSTGAQRLLWIPSASNSSSLAWLLPLNQPESWETVNGAPLKADSGVCVCVCCRDCDGNWSTQVILLTCQPQLGEAGGVG